MRRETYEKMKKARLIAKAISHLTEGRGRGQCQEEMREQRRRVRANSKPSKLEGRTWLRIPGTMSARQNTTPNKVEEHGK